MTTDQLRTAAVAAVDRLMGKHADDCGWGTGDRVLGTLRALILEAASVHGRAMGEAMRAKEER